MIYLDNAATTFPKPESVYSRLDIANREYGFNSGRGSYKKAREVSEIIDDTKKKLAKFVDSNYQNVVFQPSSTIALNTIIFGIDWNDGDNVFVTPFEHNAIMRPLEEIRKKYNINIQVIKFDKKTWELLDNLDDSFALKKPRCVLCSSKSNVTGFNLPYDKIFECAKKYQSLTILDASQSFGVEKKFYSKDLDFIVFAGHKSLYASFGIAGFINRNNIQLKNHFFGGTGSDSLNLDMPQAGPSRFEAGSQNIVAICGLNESLKWLENTDVELKEKMLFSYFCDKIKDNKKIKCYLPEEKEKCSGIISINVEGYLADDVGSILDEEYEICVRTGYHCCPLIHDFIESKEYNGTVRISMNYFNSYEDIDVLIDALKTF